MNRREMLTGVVAAAVAAAVPAVEATATWAELRDGDWTVNVWLRPLKVGSKQFEVGNFSLVANNVDITRRVTGLESVEDGYEVMNAIVGRYEERVPVDGAWHHLYVFGGRVYVDGVENPKFNEVRGGPFDGTGDYVAVL